LRGERIVDAYPHIHRARGLGRGDDRILAYRGKYPVRFLPTMQWKKSEKSVGFPAA
jgi:hypothetical protein